MIIIGAGFGGLTVAKRLKSTHFDIILIDKTNHHLFQPLLYQVASATLSPGDIAIPIREIFRGQENTTVLMGNVVQIDKKVKHVILKNKDHLSYDYLVVAPGTRHSYFGRDEWEKYAPGLKTIKDAVNIREEILISFEKAERLDNPSQTQKYLNFVIIGGGPTGVEMAGAIAEIAYNTLSRNFRRIKPERSNIYLIEAAPNILPSYPDSLANRAKKDLERIGVQVITGKKVTDITPEGVQVEDQFYPCANTIWAAGNQASPLLKSLETPLDRQGRALVEKDLSLAGHPEIFIIGDAACCLGKEGKPLPGIAPTAIQQGKYVAKILRSQTPRAERAPFKYFDKGSMATIGKGKAIAMVGKFQFAGLFAWLMWCFIHIAYLIGFRNRLAVMLEWSIFYLTGQKGARLIYNSIDEKLERNPP